MMETGPTIFPTEVPSTEEPVSDWLGATIGWLSETTTEEPDWLPETTTEEPPTPSSFPTGALEDGGPLGAIVGGVIVAVLLFLCCCAFLVLRCMFKDKGSYLTQESGDDDSLDMEDTDLQKDVARLEIQDE